MTTLNTALLNKIPSTDHARVERYLDKIEFSAVPEEWHTQFIHTCYCSEFFAEQMQKLNLAEFMQSLSQPFEQAKLEQQLDQLFELEEAALIPALRQWRNQWQCRLIWWQMHDNSVSTQELVLRVSTIADSAINFANDWSYEKLTQRFGQLQPCEHTGNPMRMVIFAMGKLGAYELNLSSDIDLIFAFSKEGMCDGEKGLAHSQFFIRQGQLIIKLLDQPTVDGFVYRTDMRLRPYGQSGPLACKFMFMSQYYQDQGREWERFAMIKARPLRGRHDNNQAAAEFIESELKPFVFRNYVDFRAMSSLRDMKAMINSEVRRLGKQENIKLGAGGIREIEFIVQAIQLIQGGKDKALQQRNIYKVLAQIKAEGYLPETVCDDLLAAYNWQRDCEHSIQLFKDQQTQMLPQDKEGRARLVASMGYEQDSEAFERDLNKHLNKVTEHFDNFIAHEEEQTQQTDGENIWQALDSTDALNDELKQALIDFKQSSAVEKMSADGRAQLDLLMPLLIHEMQKHHDGIKAWQVLHPILESVLRRSVYLVLLLENPQAIKNIIQLSLLSPWFKDQLVQYPFLLDELRDKNKLFHLPTRLEITDDLRQRMLRVPEDDLEMQMETLRHFKHARVLRAAACEISDVLPLMKISDYLTYVAEAILEEVLNISWDLLIHKHGIPQKEKGVPCSPDFCILAYGKMGGLELSYGSDLDLVFVHDAKTTLETDGQRAISNSQFFARLGQKIIHMLSTLTPSGFLYETDMRLRPSGNSGLLVSSLSGFEKYQQQDAWTWEHQALVRARFVAGSQATRAKVEEIRARILCEPRDEAELKDKVVKMRQKMRDHLGSAKVDYDSNKVFQIKQDPGGIVDLEFMVQYGVLKLAFKYSQLSKYSDNIRLIKLLAECGFFTDVQKDQLIAAYIALRSKVHAKILVNETNQLTDADQINELQLHRNNIIQIWQQIMLID